MNCALADSACQLFIVMSPILYVHPGFNYIYKYIYNAYLFHLIQHFTTCHFSRCGDKVQGCILWGTIECEWCSRAEQSGGGGGRATGGSCSHSQHPLTPPHLCRWQTPWLVMELPFSVRLCMQLYRYCVMPRTTEYKTRAFSALLEMLRWFAGQQIRNTAVRKIEKALLLFHHHLFLSCDADYWRQYL